MLDKVTLPQVFDTPSRKTVTTEIKNDTVTKILQTMFTKSSCELVMECTKVFRNSSKLIITCIKEMHETSTNLRMDLIVVLDVDIVERESASKMVSDPKQMCLWQKTYYHLL